MTRTLGFISAFALGVVMIAPVSVFAFIGADSQTDGVYCEINDVKLFAQTAEDCVKAGGVVTHTVTTTVKPAETSGDNPNEEPEIQRTKDKEPEAP